MKQDQSKNELVVMFDSVSSLFDSKEDFEYKRKKKSRQAANPKNGPVTAKANRQLNNLSAVAETRPNYFNSRRHTSISKQDLTIQSRQDQLANDYIASGGAPLRTSF